MNLLKYGMLISLDRKQSVDFLREITVSGLVDASWVSIHEQDRGNFVIKVNASQIKNWKILRKKPVSYQKKRNKLFGHIKP